MDAEQAISLVADFVRSKGLEYPTQGLHADRFQTGWRVYAPSDADNSDPSAPPDMPVCRPAFLVDDAGHIQEVTAAMPPRETRQRFTDQAAAGLHTVSDSNDLPFIAESGQRFNELNGAGPPSISGFTIIDGTPNDLGDEVPSAAKASRLLDPIVQQLAQLGPPGWQRLSAVFAFTVTAEFAQLRFWPDPHANPMPVPASIAAAVRHQRHAAAAMRAGPWWRLLLTLTNDGEMTADYDYGDEPFPDDQLLAPEHYRNDLDTYPRSHVPVWLAGYAAGRTAQGRDPRRAATEAATDTKAGRSAIPSPNLPALPDLWARWAVLSAIHVGVKSPWGPRIYPGNGWYETDQRSGSTLYVAPDGRAVLSGGKWNSALLDAAYNGGQPLPDLYQGAPYWVNDSVLNTRNRNGLLSFCLWWHDNQWFHSAATGTPADLNVAIPPVWSADGTVQAMVHHTGPDTEDQCRALLATTTNHTTTRDSLNAILANHPEAEIDSAINQLSLAGMLARCR